MVSIRLCGALSAAVLLACVSAAPEPARAQAQPAASNTIATPQTAAGHVDLSGFWGGGGGDIGAEPVSDTQDIVIAVNARDGNLANFERDSAVRQRGATSKPLYRPEHWERVRYLDQHGNVEDPEFHCMPPGVPRLGPPQKIVQSEGDVVLLYENHNLHRVIPTDGRERDVNRAFDQTWNGDSLGRWDGDTLVVETVGFNDLSWLGWMGFMHSPEMKVIERFTRDGNTLAYAVTVEDPSMLLEPWTMATRQLTLNRNPRAMMLEYLPCDERDLEQLVDPNVRG